MKYVNIDEHYEKNKDIMTCPKCGEKGALGIAEGPNPTLVEWYAIDCCGVFWFEKVQSNAKIKRRHRAIIKAEEYTYYHMRKNRKK